MPGITILGLGPGNPAKVTREAWEILSSASEAWLRTNQHPTVASLPQSLKVHSFDGLYENGESFEQVYRAIVEKVLTLGKRPQGVLYAVPGDPFIAEATGPEIARQARGLIPVKVVSGVSFLEPAFAALGLDPYPHLALVDALELSERHMPSFPPDMPLLVAQVYSNLVAAEVKTTLNNVYPDQHPVQLVHAAGTDLQLVEHLQLHQVDQSGRTGLLTVLYVPPLGEGTSFESFQEVVARLRAPDGCPWDREQTHLSLRTHLLEETYEALSAMDKEDPEKMAEEFGDLLLQIVLNAQIASETGGFDMAEVVRRINEKIIRRHPHVFGDLEVAGVPGALRNWEKLKAQERKEKDTGEKGLLDGVPAALPALSQAQEYQDRAARVGFDWPEIEGVLDKIAEEVREVKSSRDPHELVAELGDLFFSLVNLARWKQVDAESALRQANLKFKQRFAQLEQGAARQGRHPSELSLAEMESLWQEAKGLEDPGRGAPA